MFAKWYLGALLAILTGFGLYSDPATVPNQEIVVRFNDASAQAEKVEQALAAVREQLNAIGVKELHVQQLQDGSLRISYFSEVGVEVITELFAEDAFTSLGNISHEEGPVPMDPPSTEKEGYYRLNVLEIQPQSDIDLGLNGSNVEYTTGKDYYFQPKTKTQPSKSLAETHSIVVQTAYHTYERKAFEVKDTYRHTPETRAGPLS